MKGIRAIAAGLAVAACLLILVAVGPESWPLVLGWLGASLVVGLFWSRLTGTLRFGLAMSLLPLCVFLTWEGGLFFVPSVLVLIVASLERSRDMSITPPRAPASAPR